MNDNNLSIYDLFRNFWDWSFENPDLVTPTHCAVFSFAIEHCNRLGWKEKFGFPSQMAMEAIGIKSWRAYSKCFNDLVDWGFFIVHQKSKNQYSANVIAIAKKAKAQAKALDKALQKHRQKQSEYNNTNIQLYNSTNIPPADEPPAVEVDFDFNQSMLDIGADESLLAQWLEIREKEHGRNTENAFNIFTSQLKTSGADINEALQMCVDNKWVGFKADWYAKKKAVTLDFDNDETVKHLLSTKKSEDFVEIAKKSKFTLPELMVIVLKKLANKENREYFSVMSEFNNAQSIAKIIEGKRKTIDEQILMFANMVFAASNDDFWSGKITMAAINKNINNFAKYLEA